jgi:hypothetical protein
MELTKDQWGREQDRWQREQQERQLAEERRKQRRRAPPVQQPIQEVGPVEAPDASDLPDWLDTRPLTEQPTGGQAEGDGPPYWLTANSDEDEDDRAEHIGGPGLDLAARHRALLAMIERAWDEAGRQIAANEMFAVGRLLRQAVKAPRVAQSLVDSLAQSRATGSPAAANAVDKMVVDYLARNPEELVLDRTGSFLRYTRYFILSRAHMRS